MYKQEGEKKIFKRQDHKQLIIIQLFSNKLIKIDLTDINYYLKKSNFES
jgi:hypothetical protein